MIHYAIRLDDPGPKSAHALEEQIFSVLDDAGLRATVAVIPVHEQSSDVTRLVTESAAHLIAAHKRGTVEIAQHGYSHVNRSSDRNGRPTEFAGVAERDQLQLIMDGKAVLEDVFGCRIRGFVPPWNSFDQRTLNILASSGYDYISANLENLATHSDVVSVPCTCNVWELQDALVTAKRHLHRNPRVIAVLHPYDFKEVSPERGRIDLRQFSSLMEAVANVPEASCRLLSEMAFDLRVGRIDHLSFQRNRAKLPWWIRRHVPRAMLVDANLAQTLMTALT